MRIKDRINELIEAKGWSVNKLAYEAGITASTLYSIMNGNVSPTLLTLEIICETLGITLGDFFNETYEISPEEFDLLNNYNSLSEHDKKVVQLLANHIKNIEWLRNLINKITLYRSR